MLFFHPSDCQAQDIKNHIKNNIKNNIKGIEKGMEKGAEKERAKAEAEKLKSALNFKKKGIALARYLPRLKRAIEQVKN